ncbi:MAG: hypothetical protein HFE54_02480 [Turicibacter sp.]|jgi:hypothetical protein|uniref:Uncharacterized protein n=1 Tax=Turicibacter faecis TaxID=2963365 RepID=A0ABM8IM09_9FIRM|nr:MULTISPECIES: hypothetical protein [unclassified Turicibacter]MCI8701297.1 hypothetical protein [Turicibacter sp.]BEH90759.1 hypothetical protein T23_08610 [Turicibacter sp. TC023]MCI9350788.1 hypothetical protein [Turicibacter sp.]MCU7204544.1 hypothetical protein [Turicibacter sp. TA25]MCU7208926.1 hypothetical protein [Turicibacter sp. 1E2]
MKTYYTTNFDFYYDENMMDIPQAVLESEQLSPAAKNIYIYFIYLITEKVEDILGVLSQLEEARNDLEAGLSELLACGLIKKEVRCNESGEEELHYIVTKELARK